MIQVAERERGREQVGQCATAANLVRVDLYLDVVARLTSGFEVEGYGLALVELLIKQSIDQATLARLLVTNKYKNFLLFAGLHLDGALMSLLDVLVGGDAPEVVGVQLVVQDGFSAHTRGLTTSSCLLHHAFLPLSLDALLSGIILHF